MPLGVQWTVVLTCGPRGRLELSETLVLEAGEACVAADGLASTRQQQLL
jgi:hypothetical protein